MIDAVHVYPRLPLLRRHRECLAPACLLAGRALAGPLGFRRGAGDTATTRRRRVRVHRRDTRDVLLGRLALGPGPLARPAPSLPLLPLLPLTTPEPVPAILFLGRQTRADRLLRHRVAVLAAMSVAVMPVTHVVLRAQHPPLEGLHAIGRRHLRQHPRVGRQSAQVVALRLHPPRLAVTIQAEVQRLLRRGPAYRAVRVVVVLLECLVEHAVLRVLALKQKHTEASL